MVVSMMTDMRKSRRGSMVRVDFPSASKRTFILGGLFVFLRVSTLLSSALEYRGLVQWPMALDDHRGEEAHRLALETTRPGPTGIAYLKVEGS